MLLKEKLAEALQKKENDINTFIWKGKKVNGEQQSVKMVDCSVDELKKFLTHCEYMLYNNNAKTPGRYIVLEQLADIRNRCNAELFVRWLEKEKEIPRYAFNATLHSLLDNNPHIDPKSAFVKEIMDGCPKDYENITIATVLDACMDTLGNLNRKHLTLTFILKQGIWPSAEEAKKIGKTDKLVYAQKALGLKDATNLRLTPKGLSIAQMHSMLTLYNKKYSELTNQQLELLRNRILFSLGSEVKFHIRQWENRERQITRVLESKGVKL